MYGRWRGSRGSARAGRRPTLGNRGWGTWLRDIFTPVILGKVISEEQFFDACDQALRLAPTEYLPSLPPSKKLFGVSPWYPFENEAWAIGEQVRQGFSRNRTLKKNLTVVRKVLDVATCRNLRHGRQSFIMALGFVSAVGFAQELVPHLSDADVDGQVVWTLIKMKASGYGREVAPLLRSDKTWIKRLAKKYLEHYPI